MKSKQYHCRSEWCRREFEPVADQYAADILNGDIKFSPDHVSADEYPGKDAQEDEIREWVHRHVHYNEW